MSSFISESRHYANYTVIGGTTGCRTGARRCQQWRQSWHQNFRFSGIQHRIDINPLSIIRVTSYDHHGALQWRHNEHDGVSNHRRLDCLLNRLFRRRSKKASKLSVTGLCEGNHRFPSQRVRNAENGSIWWRHLGQQLFKRTTKEISKLHISSLLWGESTWYQWFPSQRTSYVEGISMPLRHHAKTGNDCI